MDGLSLAAVVYELRSLIGGRIEKVQQPERDELLLSIHSAGGGCRLLLSASPENCRVVLTDEKKLSPSEAPAFLMLMRKYLMGARIVGINQPNLDRIAEFDIETYSELKDIVRLKLVCEVMGRHSNIILLDEDGSVIDAIRRVGPSVSSARIVLPKVRYEYPPSKKKNDPLLAEAFNFADVIRNSMKPEAALSENFYGLSPAVAKKLIASLGFPECGAEELGTRLAGFYADFRKGRFSPCIVTAGGAYVSTLPFDPKDGSEVRRFGSMNEAVCEFYSGRAASESIKRRTSSYEHVIKNAVAKLEKKLGIFSAAISSEEENEKLRLYGELLTANLYSVPNKTDHAAVMNYYLDPPALIEIPLDPKLSAADNAQKYYSKYRKAKLSRDHALKMASEVSKELDYLEELLYTLSCCEGESELNEIRQELISSGYLQENPKQKRSAAPVKLPPSKPYSYRSRDGFEILVGKNNRQNDKLTLSTAEPSDTWLHVKDIHGSHVIIRNGGRLTDTALFDAAMLAAYYSKARGSATVPVDYAEARYVKKPSGAKPGMVIYTHQHTVYVTPDADHLKKL